MLNRLPQYWFNKNGNSQRRVVTVTDGSVATSYVNNLIGIQLRFVPHDGGEVGGQDRLNTQNPNKIYVNGVVDIVATDRITFDGHVYDILSANNFDENSTYMRFDAVEVQPSGVGA